MLLQECEVMNVLIFEIINSLNHDWEDGTADELYILW
jgi:hypothetical protein